MKNKLLLFVGLLFLMLITLMICLAWKPDDTSHKKKFRKKPDYDFVIIEGKQFPLVVDDQDNWYIKQQLYFGMSIYIPANFETDTDNETF